MTQSASPQVSADAEKLLTYMDSKGLDGAVEVTRGYTHMGALILHSALQRTRKAPVVWSRVDRLLKAWPDADTTSGFIRRLTANDTDHTGYGDLGEVIGWNGPERLVQVVETAELFSRYNIETVDHLRTILSDPDGRGTLRRGLRGIRNVGPKTRDFFDILAGLNHTAAIDVRIKLAADRAGIEDRSYEHLSAVLGEAARRRGWRIGDLDAVLWDAHGG